MGVRKRCSLLLPGASLLGLLLQCKEQSEKWQSSGSREEWAGVGQGMGLWAGGRGSVESTAPQIFGNDDVRHGVKDKLDVVGVRGTGDVGVDLLVG